MKLCKCGSPVTTLRATWCDECRYQRREYQNVMPERPCRMEGCTAILPPSKARFCKPCQKLRQGRSAEQVRQQQKRSGLRDRADDYTPEQIDALYELARKRQKYNDWLAREAARKGQAA